MTDAKRNVLLKILVTLLEGVAYAIASGTLLQVFLNTIGFSASQIYLHTTINQAVQIAVTLTCSRVGERGNPIRRYAYLIVAQGATFLLYIPLCIRMQADLGAYLLLLTIGILNVIAGGLGGLLSYTVPYLIYNPRDYGAVTAACGIISSLLSMGVGIIMAALTERYSYKAIMLWAFPIAAVLLITSGFLCRSLRPLIDPATIQEKKERKKTDFGAVWQVLRQPIFYQLAPSNIFRGFAGGMAGVLAVVAAADLGYSEQITTTLVSVQAAAQLIGCLLFGVLSRRICPRHTIFVSSLSFLCLPFLLIPNHPILFLCLAAVINMGHYAEMYAVPDLLMRVIPGQIAGTYNAYRLILNHIGTLLATALAAILPSSVMLPLAMAFQLMSGACYFFLPILRKAAPAASH